MIEDIEFIASLKQRHPNVDDVVFVRSVEYAKTNVELFDILEDIPKTYPIQWSSELRRWVTASDLYFIDKRKFVEND